MSSFKPHLMDLLSFYSHNVFSESALNILVHCDIELLSLLLSVTFAFFKIKYLFKHFRDAAKLGRTGIFYIPLFPHMRSLLHFPKTVVHIGNMCNIDFCIYINEIDLSVVFYSYEMLPLFSGRDYRALA